MTSRPSAFRRWAVSAMTMIALGLARAIRLASWGIAGTSGFWGWSWGAVPGEYQGAACGCPRGAGQPLILASGPGGAGRSGRHHLVPFGDPVGLRSQRCVGIALDLHRLDGVAL